MTSDLVMFSIQPKKTAISWVALEIALNRKGMQQTKLGHQITLEHPNCSSKQKQIYKKLMFTLWA